MRGRGVIVLAFLGLLAVAAVANDDQGSVTIGALVERLRVNPGDPVVMRSLGWALLEYRHNAAAAFPLLVRAVEGDPADLRGHKLLALASVGTGRIHRAIAEFELVLRQDPTDVWMWVNLGDALMAENHFSGARQAYVRALQLQPDYPPAIRALRVWADLRAPQVSLSEQSFTSSGGFTVDATTIALHSGFGDAGQFTLAASSGAFLQNGARLLRDELRAELDISASPTVGLRFQTLATDDRATGQQVGGGIGAVWSRAVGVLSFSAQARTPVFPDSFRGALLGIVTNQLSVGMDQSVHRSLSVQAIAEYGEYSDRNRRQYVLAQLSQRLPGRTKAFARLRYERLAFPARSTAYFSPTLFEIIRPQADFRWPAARRIAFDAQAALLFLPRDFRVGRSLAWGARIQTTHITLRASGTDDFVPATKAWSGRGLRIEGTWTF